MSGSNKPGKVFKGTVLSVTGSTAVIETDEEGINYLEGIISVESIFNVITPRAGGQPGGGKPSSDPTT